MLSVKKYFLTFHLKKPHFFTTNNSGFFLMDNCAEFKRHVVVAASNVWDLWRGERRAKAVGWFYVDHVVAGPSHEFKARRCHVAKINMNSAQKTDKLLLVKNGRTYYNFHKEINCKDVYKVVFVKDKGQRIKTLLRI
jgi:hypothetical protein